MSGLSAPGLLTPLSRPSLSLAAALPRMRAVAVCAASAALSPAIRTTSWTLGVPAAAAMSTASTSSSPASVRVVSYNVLSSKLARTSHFTSSDPEHLCFENRKAKVLAKLDESLKADRPTVVALQEVCYPFASELHTYFANRGYAFVTGLYGRVSWSICSHCSHNRKVPSFAQVSVYRRF